MLRICGLAYVLVVWIVLEWRLIETELCAEVSELAVEIAEARRPVCTVENAFTKVGVRELFDVPQQITVEDVPDGARCVVHGVLLFGIPGRTKRIQAVDVLDLEGGNHGVVRGCRAVGVAQVYFDC